MAIQNVETIYKQVSSWAMHATNLGQTMESFQQMGILERSTSCRSKDTSRSVGQVGADKTYVRRRGGLKRSHGVCDGSFSHCIGCGFGHSTLSGGRAF